MANPFYIPPRSSTANFALQTLGTLGQLRQGRERNEIAQRANELDQMKLAQEKEQFGIQSEQVNEDQAIRRRANVLKEADMPAHKRPLKPLDVTKMKKVAMDLGIEKYVKEDIKDFMKSAQEGVAREVPIKNLMGKINAKKKEWYEEMEKDWMKAVDEGDNTRAYDLAETMRLISDDKDGELILGQVYGASLQSMAMEDAAAQKETKLYETEKGWLPAELALGLQKHDPTQQTEVPAALNEFEMTMYGKPVPEMRGTPGYKDNWLTYLKQKRDATTSPNRTEPAVLRKEFINQSKDFVKVRDSWNRIKASAENPSPAGDLAMIFNYMKVLDPGSVVRESEFATAAQTGAYGERIKAAVQRIVGGERLSDEMRKDFRDRAKLLYKEQEKSHDKLQKEYDRLAKEMGVEPSNVLIDYVTEQAKIEQGEYEQDAVYTDANGIKKRFLGYDANNEPIWGEVE